MKKLIPALFLCFVGNAIAQSTLISQFDFNGGYTDNFSNGTCVSYNNSATLFAAGSLQWTYGANDTGGGVKVIIPDAVFSEDHFSIAIDCRFSETSGYRKMIDFKSLNSDQGVYVNSQLRLYSIGGYGATTINPDSNFTILMTRDSVTDTTKLYLFDGVNMVLQSSGLDLSSNFVADLMLTNRVIHFFADDSITLGEHATSGVVNQIRIWNGVASFSDLLNVDIESASPSFNIYPNPAVDKVQIDFKSPVSGILDVYTLQGHLIKQVSLHEESILLMDVHDFPSGVYIVRYQGKSFRLVK